ncbi:hypothetical protein TNCT_207811 [Trichonephila clavata]|uniref:Uncharacterized protein n=1 Tax=Trichonephila clavata TaxID=2740835 RepID=A0A8X6IKK3_TRICU|nr:hypothetical protein TNCT_207811 [Trichonephila clavata]
MFVEPHMIDGQFPRVTHVCPNCTPKAITLVLVHDQQRLEYTLSGTRYQQQGQKVSLEWVIARPNNSGFFYSLGEGGSLLVSRENNTKIIQIRPEIVRTIAGLSTDFCK